MKIDHITVPIEGAAKVAPFVLSKIGISGIKGVAHFVRYELTQIHK